MEDIDLREFIYNLLKRIRIIVVITILCMVIIGFLSFFVLEPKYETFTTLMLGKPNNYSIGEKIKYDDVLLNQKLVSTYGEIAKSRTVSDEVIKNLKLDLTPVELRDKTNVSLVKDTEIIKISVIDYSPDLAAKIANEIAKVFMINVSNIMKIENVQIIDKAQIPTEPFSPNKVMYIFIAGVGGLMVSISLVFFLEYLDNTLKTPEDIKKYLDLPAIGMIPKMINNGDVRIIVTDENPKSPVAESYRTLRTNIQFSNIDKNIKSLLLTSTGPGEGKSTTAVNLAVTLAKLNKKVIIIDCDLRKPVLHKYFNRSNLYGLTNVIVKDREYSEAVRDTVVENLYLLTSGPIPPNPSEILGSKKMEDLLTRIKSDYDMVIIDSPPIGAVTDAAVLSTLVDGLILICEVGKTKITASKYAVELLDRVKGNVLGVVMNKIPINDSGYYKYHYPNYYSYNDRVLEDESKRKKVLKRKKEKS